MVLVHHSPKLFIASRALSSRPRVVHVCNNLRQFIEPRPLIRAQLVYLDFGPLMGVIKKIYNLLHHVLG